MKKGCSKEEQPESRRSGLCFRGLLMLAEFADFDGFLAGLDIVEHLDSGAPADRTSSPAVVGLIPKTAPTVILTH
jgi:hypothetical protein